MDTISQSEPQLPNGKMNSENSDFKKVIEESRKNIQDATADKERKRGRGRPPKKRPDENPTSNTNAPLPTVTQSAQPAPDVTGYLKDPLMFLSKIPAAKHGVPELALTEDEAKACAEGLNGVLQAFVPDMGTMDPKTASILSLGMVIGSIGVQKYMILMSKKPKAEEPAKVETPQAPLPTAENFFNVMRA